MRSGIIKLLIEKKDDPTITHASIELRAGHGRMQPVRPGKPIDLKGPEETLRCGNEGNRTTQPRTSSSGCRT